MTIQDINNSLQTLRTVIAQYELPKHSLVLDAVSFYLEAQRPVISVAGARTSGKCALVNSLAETDILPSRIFKPHSLYIIGSGTGQPKVRLSSGNEMPIRSLADVERVTKQDYDTKVLLEANTGIFQSAKIELRTGFDIEDKCPLLNCVLADIIIVCVKATALFSLEDMSFIDGLKKMGHRKVLVCVTHLNDVSPKAIPDIVKFIATKHIPYPIAYYSDESIDTVPEVIRDTYGTEYIRQVLSQMISGGINYNNRLPVVSSMLSDLKEAIINELSEKKAQLEQLKDKKYSTYLSKVAKHESMMLGWTDIRFEYEKRETKCTDTILTELNKAKGKLVSRLKASVISVPSPKDWWENIFPLTLKNEIDAISTGIDNMLQPQIIRDFNWLNHELQVRFHQTIDKGNTVVGETTLDYVLDSSSLSFSNLRAARYISMAGGASLATALFMTVGPVGALASASCTILGDRYINKVILEQRARLENAVENIIDDVFEKMSAMIPTRVSGLYEEMAKAIAEKEKAWTTSNPIGEFTCDEMLAIEKLSSTIDHLHN